MHHHHPPLPSITTASVATNTTVAGSVATNPPPPPQQLQRRRKKRPNYGTRVVEVRRGYNGFGFTISGQQPCRLSCIITNSPAEQAGLRAGDFLISVNGLNVSKLPHETVVQLIGNSFGSIRMQIAENYYSDSSDEENINASLLHQQHGGLGRRGGLLSASLVSGARAKPRFMHHKTKMHRLRNSPQKNRETEEKLRFPKPTLQKQLPSLAQSLDSIVQPLETPTLRPVVEDLPPPVIKPSVSKTMPNVNVPATSSDVANVSAMVRVVASVALEYRAIVGYLGTIEMPKQISHSSKLQTVRSCIRKLRQEKRQPTIVLMSILPDCLRLQSANGNVLATYASSRLNYVSSSSESENRFFGLVTSAVHNTQIEEEYEVEAGDDNKSATGHISISHSCHVFVIDIKLVEHTQHLQRADEFHVQCTRDPISNLCLEFPNNSEYVVNLIRSMYTMRILPPATRSLNEFENGAGAMGGGAAHSPQPSNHSEISTTTSNSDSGIGFNNDCTNISDRILVVDFPGAAGNGAAASDGVAQAPTHSAATLQQPSQRHTRPLGICCDLTVSASISDKRLTVRAMPDPKSPVPLRRPNLLANFNLIKSPATSLTATRSCDDVLSLIDDVGHVGNSALPPHASMDDISLHTTPSADEGSTFLHPSLLPTGAQRKMRYSLQPMSTSTATTPHKLSPQVFGDFTRPAPPPKVRHSLGFPAIDSADMKPVIMSPNNKINYDVMETWCSLQDLHGAAMNTQEHVPNNLGLLEATNSEPDLGNRPLPANASPFRRAWGQSSFRTGRTDKHSNTASGQQQELVEQRNSPVVRRTASMTASDNDVYVKSMDGFIDELKQQTRSSRAQQKLMMVPQIHTKQPTPAASDDTDGPYGVAAWGTSFERMLQDTAGMQTFAEFLKKEFSAENIYFWTACERYRLLESEAERITQAHEIYNKHLSNESKDPVNVDSQARNLSKEKLESGATDIFAPAQKQIFNLMKFDSYQRFIRSDLYRSCLEAEEKQQALPYSGEGLDELLKTNFHVLASSTKLKKSASNAEDRRRKSLLPWHRKTRSKSRDRNELLNEVTCSSGSNGQKVNTLMLAPPNKLATLSSSSLKIASTQNSLSDVYSSRSSLSSYDANTANAQTAEMVCSLCRVILSDGATTIVQTRADETVGQLVERLLEKRGLSYQYYDVVFNGCTKSIDMQLPSQTLAGKEVLIEQRVVFKLDLPDPKVISVKSKPKKQLYDVIRPILHKYNYSMSGVQVLLRDTLAQIDLTQSVTVADGQRLKIVLLQPSQSQQDFQQSGGTSLPPKLTKPMTASKFGNIPPTLTSRSVSIQSNRTSVGSVVGANTTNCSTAAASQSTLDEITNKVFNELLQGKVEAQRTCDLSSLKSEDCASETSSIFDRMRRRDSNIPGSKLPKFKKKSTSSQQSEDAMQTTTTLSLLIDPKKPIIAKLKAGVKLQVTERVAEHQDELLEGLKRAQLARLEDQRGTEINCELPEFLKHKENLSAASKLRKARANLSPITKPPPTSPTSLSPTEALSSPSTSCAPPQPAPRLSITQKHKTVSPMKVDEEDEQLEDTNGVTMQESTILPVESNPTVKGPPPLPPKPKVLPIKPSNWGVSSSISTGKHISPSMTAASSKIPIEIGRKALLTAEQTSARCAYLDEPSSSFV